MIGAAIMEFSQPEVNMREILRYARTARDDEAAIGRIEELLRLALPELSYRVVYTALDTSFDGASCDLGAIKLSSSDLVRCIGKCRRVIVFAATVGAKMDRLINKYGAISARDALLLNAIGAERVESLCDEFVAAAASEYGKLTPRFSPGYGDLSIEAQRDIFRLIKPESSIGVTLGDGLLMSPSKSVTAIAGILN